LDLKAHLLKRYPGILRIANNERLILGRLKKAIAHAREGRFYRGKLKGIDTSRIRSLSDYRRTIPETTREEIVAADPYDTIAIAPGSKCMIYSQTSGTTGGHVPLWVTKDELERSVSMAVCLPVFQNLMNKHDKVALCYPYTRTLAGRTADMINQRMGVTVIPMGTRNNLYPPDEVVDTILKLKPTILGAAATDAFSYANIMMDRGIDPSKLGIRLIVSGAEPLSANRAKVLGRIYRAKALSLLGQNEVGIAIPCEHNVLHLPSFAMYTEVYRDDGSEAAPGERGSSVVTPTWREAQPILRYRTGDVIRLIDEPCPCGLPLPTMEILGRKRTEISLGGKSYFPIELEDMLYRHDIDGPWYRITIREDGIKIDIEHRGEDSKRLPDEIASSLGKDLKTHVEVEVVKPGTLYDYRSIRPGKALSRVVDTVKGKDEVIEGA
jgi:phenylacetate-CoA ligase